MKAHPGFANLGITSEDIRNKVRSIENATKKKAGKAQEAEKASAAETLATLSTTNVSVGAIKYHQCLRSRRNKSPLL